MSGPIDWAQLSERSGAILRRIEIPVLLGFSTGEVAGRLGTSSSWVLKRRLELRDELERLAG